jgi:hypothetical protein
MEHITILLHVCDGIGHLNSSLPSSPSRGTVARKIAVRGEITSFNGMKEETIQHATTSASKSARLLLFDDKLELEVPSQTDVEGSIFKLSLIHAHANSTESATAIDIDPLYFKAPLKEFIRQFSSILPRRIDHIFELTATAIVSSSNQSAVEPSQASSSSSSIRLRVGVLIISSKLEKSVSDNLKADFLRVSTKLALPPPQSRSRGLNSSHTINDSTMSQHLVTTGNPAVDSPFIKQNQKMMIQSLHSIFNSIRKVSKLTSQVHAPSNTIIEFIRLLSEDFAQRTQLLVEAVLAETEKLGSREEYLSEQESVMILQSLLNRDATQAIKSRSVSSITIPSIGPDFHCDSQRNALLADEIALLFRQVRIKRKSSAAATDGEMIYKLYFYEDSVKAFVFKLLSRKPDSIASVTSDWKIKVAVMERLLEDMNRNLDLIGIVAVPSTGIDPPQTPSDLQPAETDLTSSSPTRESKSLEVAFLTPEQAAYRLQALQKKAEVHMSMSKTTTSTVSATADPSALIAQDLAAAAALKESIQQIIDKYFDLNINSSASTVSSSPSPSKKAIVTAVAVEKYQKFVAVIESLRKLERRLNGAVRRLLSSPTELTAHPAADTKPSQQMIASSIIKELAEALSKLSPHIHITKYRDDLSRLLASSWLQHTALDDLLRRISNRMSNAWMEEILQAFTCAASLDLDSRFSTASSSISSRVVVENIIDSMCREVEVRATPSLAFTDASTVLRILSVKSMNSLLRQARVSQMLRDAGTISNANSAMMTSQFSERDLLLLYGIAMSCPGVDAHRDGGVRTCAALCRAMNEGYDAMRVLSVAFIYHRLIAVDPSHGLCSAADFISWINEIFCETPIVSSTLFQGKDVKSTSSFAERSNQRIESIARKYYDFKNDVVAVRSDVVQLQHSQVNAAFSDEPISRITVNKVHSHDDDRQSAVEKTMDSVEVSKPNVVSQTSIIAMSVSSAPTAAAENQTSATQLLREHQLTTAEHSKTSTRTDLMDISDDASKTLTAEFSSSMLPSATAASTTVETGLSATYPAASSATSMLLHQGTSTSILGPTQQQQQQSSAIALDQLPSLAVGDKVLGLFESAGDWFPATIQRIDAKLAAAHPEKYFLLYDDGDQGYCSRLMLRRPQDKQPRMLAIGQQVLARIGGDESYLPAVVAEVIISSELSATDAKEVYRIEALADGSVHELSRDAIIGPFLDKATIDTLRSATVTKRIPDGEVKLGDRVEGRFGAGREFYPARIYRIHGHAQPPLYDLRYDDGDAEEAIARRKFRYPGQANAMQSSLALNQLVDAPCRLLSLLSITQDDSNVVEGRIRGLDEDRSQGYLVEFDLEALGLREDVENQLVSMDEAAVEKIAELCEVNEENGGLLVSERIPRASIYA